MRLLNYLIEQDEINFPDSGAKGKVFEKIFTRALEIAGLDHEKNTQTGRVWDIKPKGSGWDNFLSNKNINIKTASAVWMFGSKELGNILPWDGFKEFDENKAASKVKRFLNKLGINQVIYLKPKDQEIQKKLISAVKNKDKDELNNILINKNFFAETLGKNYSVRVLTKDDRVSSIAIDKGGKVFMRSERPRKIGGSSDVVTFRTPSTKIGRNFKRIKV